MNERVKFIARYVQHEEPFAALCEAAGISRKTGYKWVERYDAGGVAALVDRSRAPLSTLLECVIESALPLANERRQTLTSDFDTEPVYLNMDLLRLSQALLNIIANATKYTEGKGNIQVWDFSVK